MTSLTIAVHEQLLRKRRGLTAHSEGHAPAPFGSSTGRYGNSSATTAAASVQAPALASAAAAQVVANMAASGNRVDLSQARRAAPTVPRQWPMRPMPVYVVPRPIQQPQPCLQQYKVPLDRLEPLQGWQHTNREGQSGVMTLTSARSPRQPQAPSAAAAAQLDATALPPVEPSSHLALQRCASSVKSSESSWAG